MKKFVLLLSAAAVAIYGTYSLVSALQKPDDAASAPAAVGSIEIAPAQAFVHTALQARVEGKRGSLADPGACRWFVNGAEVAGVTSSTLEPGHFKKGDAVRVEVGTDISATVVIANTPPRITSASADLKQEPSAEIFVRVTANDVDDDPITYSYEWFKNGKKVDGETGATIDVSKFQKGDKVYANVTAADDQESGSPRRSDPITLGSNAPKITSTPPQALGDERSFVYQVTVAPGPASLRYELVEAPEGMTIDSRGRIEWTVPKHESADESRVHKAVVRVTDPTGGSSEQEFSITTSMQASTASQ